MRTGTEPLYLVRTKDGTEHRGLTLKETLPFVLRDDWVDIIPDGYEEDDND